MFLGPALVEHRDSEPIELTSPRWTAWVLAHLVLLALALLTIVLLDGLP